MKKLLGLTLCALLWSATAHAAVIWTCTRDATVLASSGYTVYGNCVANGTPTAGGDGFDADGGAGTATDAGIALCGGSTKIVVDAIFSSLASPGGGTNGGTVTWDGTNSRGMIHGGGAAAAALQNQTGTALSNAITRFVALCR